MTTSLVANIARPISSALSTVFNSDNIGLLTNYGLLGVANPDAVIEALFASGEQGAWYDPSDLSTMFQDSAGTTPVTAVGQPVGRISDKSGNSNHAFQDTTSKKPILQNDGVNNYLAFDGVDDALATASIDFTATDKMSVFSGVRKNSGNGYQTLIELGAGVVENGFSIFAPNNSNNNYDFRLATNARETSLVYAPPITNVLSVTHDIAGASITTETFPRINGAPVGFVGAGTVSGNFINAVVNIGARNQVSLPLNGRIYSLIVLGRLATTQEITNTEAWVADKTGVVLP